MVSSCIIMLALMYGVIPMAISVIWLKALPVIMLTSSSSGRLEVLFWLITFAISTPGAGITPTRRKSTSIMKV